jgi:hypothetical protein
MKFNDTDILFASLVGSKVIEQIPRFTAVQNELMKHVLPPFNILPVQTDQINVDAVKGEARTDLWQADAPTAEADQFFPLSLSIDGRITWFLLPYEPLITINGKNEIIRRKVAKSASNDGVIKRGSIKERWNQDDYEITITGVLIGSVMTGNMGDCFPLKQFQDLRDFLTAPKSIDVKCAPLHELGIDKIVIEDFSFPFTKGENVQAYEIKAYSDYDYKLLLDIND